MFALLSALKPSNLHFSISARVGIVVTELAFSKDLAIHSRFFELGQHNYEISF